MNPKQRFPHSTNTELLSAIEAQASPRKSDPDLRSWDIDEYELHAHPDLCERIWSLAKSLPEVQHQAAYGCPVLVTANGVIFAFARGTSDLGLRLPPDGFDIPLEQAVEVVTDYGPEWFLARPYPHEGTLAESIEKLKSGCKQAWEYASGL